MMLTSSTNSTTNGTINTDRSDSLFLRSPEFCKAIELIERLSRTLQPTASRLSRRVPARRAAGEIRIFELSGKFGSPRQQVSVYSSIFKRS
jgi:hypothetical protein